MEKVTREHLGRQAYVYVRQSTLSQLERNVESRRVQEKLVERAQELGWREPVLVDDDLGCTASGVVKRAGFEKMLAAVCAGEVGAIFAFEASRLARNGREWHTLLEMCALVDTILIDTESVYDPKVANDRLLLGVKGTLSELELGLFRARSQAAIREKAKRGEFFGLVPVGYRKGKEGGLEKEPDSRVQRAIEFVFEKFPKFGSIRQLVRWMREEQIEIPRKAQNTDDSPISWRPPTQAAISSMLNNPIYAGAYAYGKTKRRTVVENGRKRVIIRRCSDPKDWEILIPNNHSKYISWEQYERNIEMLASNVNMKGKMKSGGVRGGASIYAGILRCGECGRRVLVSYSGSHSKSIRYTCGTNSRNDDGRRCLSFSANVLEEKITFELLETISPFGVEASLEAARKLSAEEDAVREQKELALTEAQYRSQLAQKQYDEVDPSNRLVAGELERRWNEALQKVARLEEELRTLRVQEPLSADEQEALMELGEDFSSVWNHPETSSETKKRIARLLVKEVVLFDEQTKVRAIVHWQGGVHTEVVAPRLTYRDSSSPTDTDTVSLIQALARQMPDQHIARTLNRLKISTAKGLTWNEARVRAIRHGYKIEVYREGEREKRGECNMFEAAKELGVDRRVISQLIDSGLLNASQSCRYAPWVIKKRDLRSEKIQHYLNSGRIPSPCAENQNQLSLQIQ